MTQLGQIPLIYLFSPFSLQLQFPPCCVPFLPYKPICLFYLLTCKKEITKDFSIYCKRTKGNTTQGKNRK